MNTPYQRIKIPTSEKWNSAGQSAPTSAPASAQQAPTDAVVAPLLIQPPCALIAKAPSAQSMTAIQKNLLKGSSRLKPWIVAGALLLLLATAASVFAAQEQEVVAQPSATEVSTQQDTFNTLEQHVMTEPNTMPQANGNTNLKASTSAVGTGENQSPVTTNAANSTEANANKLRIGEPKRTTDPTRTNNQVVVAPVQQANSSTPRDQPQLGATAPPASPQQAATPKDSTQTTKSAQPVPPAAVTSVATESSQDLDTRSLALLALGVAGAGAVASVGLAITARRSKTKVGKFQFEELAPAQTPTQPAASAKVPVDEHRPNIPQRASDLAYIDQNDWAAALERTFAVNTRPGPHNALVSLVGSRNANEDYGCSYELKDAQAGSALQCMFVADGCGGHNGGREASCLAVRAASEAVLQEVKANPTQRVQAAFNAASAALIRAGRHWDANSLRTTLIVVLADESNYYCGWIGDGGIDLHRANGQWEALLIPHKSGAQNLLAASLGPDQVGKPSFATHARQPGDRLYVGSDGVFDVYSDPSAFWGSWFEGASTARAPQTCLTELLAKCAEHTAFDDNMTVAYLHTPAHRVTTKSPNLTSSGQRLAHRTSSQRTQPA